MRIENLLYRQKNNENIAIKYCDDFITFTEWYHCSDYTANKLIRLKSNSTVSIATFLPNSINYAVAYFAIQFASKILIPIGTKAKAPEIVSTLEYCEVDIIITDSDHIYYLIDNLSEYNYKIILYNIDNNTEIELNTLKPWVEKSNILSQRGHDTDVALMLHTSGTTSNPKRVMLSHYNIISNIESNIESLALTDKEKVLLSLPMYFGYCNTAQFLTHLYLGARIIIHSGAFLPKSFLEIVEREEITNFTAVPSMLLILLNYKSYYRHDYSCLRKVCFGGGNMPTDKLKLLIDRFKTIEFIQTYGQTECSPRVTALLNPYSLSRIGSVGKTIPNVEICILSEKDTMLDKNQIGEIAVKGPNVMVGYYKQPEITALVKKNGWLHTGDLGYLDDDGFLYLTGRIKNMIISGGINIYPEEVEQILMQHESVKEVVVIGEKHPILGEVPIAKVVLNHEIESSFLKKYCTEQMADYKVPVRIDFFDSLPKTYNGKIKRFS